MSSPTKPVTTIDDLPPEMICKLFEHLQLKELVACSLVNKRWHSIYAGFRVQRLIAVKDDYSNHCAIKWHPSDRDVYHLKTFSILVEQPLFSNLKHLFLSAKSPEFNLDSLNALSQLVRLEFNIECLRQEGVKLNLNLSKLKILILHQLKSASLSIDCPQLNVLTFHKDPKKLSIKHPETIRKLMTNKFDSKWLAPFKNVECLVTKAFGAICPATLLSLPKLKELHYNAEINGYLAGFFNNELGTLDRMRQALKKFIDDVWLLKGSDFKFRFAGFKLTSKDVDKMEFDVVGEEREFVYNESVYMKNYQLIGPDAILDFIRGFDYHRLMSNAAGKIPSCFFKKFPNLHFIEADGKIENVDHFLWFLKPLGTLTGLDLKDSRLSQEFYDQLPTICPYLLRLNLNLCKDNENGMRFNFDFIHKLSSLSDLSLKVDQELPPESITWLIRLLGKFGTGSLRFQTLGKSFEVSRFYHSTFTRIDNNRYSSEESLLWRLVNHSEESTFDTENIEEIVNFFEWLYSDPATKDQFSAKLPVFNPSCKLHGSWRL